MTSESVEKNRDVRYDRQLRLWGDSGQRRLEAAHVCLLNCGALGCEILKSLVLPGIGQFTIIDGKKVTGRDAGSNFFLDRDSIGKSRARVAVALLKELNPDVKGRCVEESPERLLQNNVSVLESFNLVIGTGLREKTASCVAEYLWKRHIPFVLTRCYGLLGHIRVAVGEHAVVESHPANPPADLRLDCPFKELQDFVDATDLDALNHQDHSHTPYSILLAKAVEEWRKTQSTIEFPSTYAEKKAVKQILLGMRKPDEKGRLDEENFEEAVNAVNGSLVRTRVPADVAAAVSDPAAEQPVSQFWALVAALKRFIDKRRVLPVRGSLPDMTADSARYIQLLDVYRRKAKEDTATLHKLLTEVIAECGLKLEVSKEDVEWFCKHCAFIKVIRGRSLREELGWDTALVDVIRGGLERAEEDASMVWYLLLRAAERFCAEKDRYPGTNGIPVELDRRDLFSRVRMLGKELGLEELVKAQVPENLVIEMCRYGASELHVMASLLGGIVAQEAIKLLTAQYVPLDNTLIVDGHTGRARAFRL